MLAAAIVLAPLAAGGVHRISMFVLLLMAALALVLLVAGEAIGGGSLRMTLAVVAPALLLALPALQSVPLPSALQNRLDPAGAQLIAGGPSGNAVLRPYSLDPPATRSAMGRAAAALAVFLVAAHLASGRSFRQLLLPVVVGTGIAAVIIGFGHRILGEDHIYGTFSAGRGILNGPFINPNHTAQFLELAFFGALALAYAKTSALNRVGWFAAATFLIAGVLGTLSRGGVLALAVSGMLFLAFRGFAQPEEGTAGRRRTSWFWLGLVLAIMIIVAGSLGAGQLLAKFSQSSFTQETRFRLWVDGFKLVLVHPFGIGRGGFERVYPTMQTIEGAIPVRFSFLENEPLQLLVETGWLGFAGVIAGAALLVRELHRHGRRDAVELSLVCGLVAVLTHNLVDFGLETLGVLLPFAAVLGIVVGRTKGWVDRLLPARWTMGLSAAAVLALFVGAGSLAHGSDTDFDARIRGASTSAERREWARKAQAAHPADYFYVLSEALTEPLTPGPGGVSPRLRVLNRALLLCPGCPEVHGEVARSLLALGKRRQAMLEWKVAVTRRRIILPDVLAEAWALGARADELSVLGDGDPNRLLTIASFLMAKSARVAARKVIDSALMAGAPAKDVYLLRAQLSVDEGQLEQALREIGEVEKVAPQDSRVFALKAETTMRSVGAAAALDVLDQGVAANPNDLVLQRRRLQLVIEGEKWSRAKAAMEGLEIALFHARMPTSEVHVAGARVAVRLGDTKQAIAEYRTAINQNPNDATSWMELGRLYQSLGRDEEALRAFREAQLLAPDAAEVTAAIEQVLARKAQLEAAATRSNYLNSP